MTKPHAETGGGGNEGQQCLARHLSSSFGFLGDGGASACTWAFEREELFRQIAAAPFENRTWMDASKPWQALAAVFEWVAYLDAVDRFESRLPISTESHPRWQRRSSHHQEKVLAAIQAAQASGIALTGLKPEHLVTHAASAGQAMSILEEADKVGVEAERQDLLREAERLSGITGSARATTKTASHGGPIAQPSGREERAGIAPSPLPTRKTQQTVRVMRPSGDDACPLRQPRGLEHPPGIR
ncbi:DNA-directed RNA polymerase [Methylobacterium terrae]|uniref:DNA-directed RNA polymerase n=1 Tax=Methylobacterium terrae TaxID=2202827 RepID=UPI0013A53154